MHIWSIGDGGFCVDTYVGTNIYFKIRPFFIGPLLDDVSSRGSYVLQLYLTRESMSLYLYVCVVQVVYKCSM